MTSPESVYRRASDLLDAIANSLTLGDLAEAIAGQTRVSQLATKTAKFVYWDRTDPDEVKTMQESVITPALRRAARGRNEELSRGALTVGKEEVKDFITHRLMITEVERLRYELDGVEEAEIRSRNSARPISRDLGRALLEALFTRAFGGINSFISKVELSRDVHEAFELYDLIDTGISSIQRRLDDADGMEVGERLIEGHRGELLTERFVEELNIRFDKRTSENGCNWKLNPRRVLRRVRRAICLNHYKEVTEEVCRAMLTKLSDRKGDISMKGPPTPTKGGCCIKFLYPDVEKAVSKPLVYINAYNEARGVTHAEPVDLNGVRTDDVDYCDKWSFGLLADLFSDDWETMEKAIYGNSQPRFYDSGTLGVVQDYFSTPDLNPWATKMSPWVIFEVATAYSLDVNAHLQDLSDSICSGISRDIEYNIEDLDRADRVLGGLASCFNRECLKKLRRVHVAVMKNNLFGCLMVMDEAKRVCPNFGRLYQVPVELARER